jgi:hypothetical protein
MLVEVGGCWLRQGSDVLCLRALWSLGDVELDLLVRGCCIARSQSSREPQIEVGQIAMTSSSKAAGTRRFTACSVPSS